LFSLLSHHNWMEQMEAPPMWQALRPMFDRA